MVVSNVDSLFCRGRNTTESWLCFGLIRHSLSTLGWVHGTSSINTTLYFLDLAGFFYRLRPCAYFVGDAGTRVNLYRMRSLPETPNLLRKKIFGRTNLWFGIGRGNAALVDYAIPHSIRF